MAIIVVVDDCPSNRQLLVTLLGYQGHRVIEATDGGEGLEAAGTEPPNLVSADMLMPTLDGYELVRHRRAAPALAHIPAVFWSAPGLAREARPLTSACGVSHIMVAERVVGVMALFARTPLGDATIEALAAVADQVALGIERAKAEARVQQQLTRLALLRHITRAIAERQDLYSIGLVVLRYLEQDLPLEFACLCLGDSGSDTMTVMAVGPASQALAPTVGLAERVVVSLDQIGLHACVAGQTVSVCNTAEESRPLLHRFAQAGLRSLIATPLLVEGNIFGLLLTARREPQGFSSGEGEFLRQLSEHVALAAHHASLYAKLQQAYDGLHQSQQVVMQQERLRALGQMASGIAHDINNAISPITLYVEFLLASEAMLSTRARAYLTT